MIKNIFLPITKPFVKFFTKLRSRAERKLIKKIYAAKLTYLSKPKLQNLITTCKEIERKNIPGIFIEAGCALGGSSILISKFKAKKRPFFIYDVFGMIPSPTEADTKDVHDRYSEILAGKSKGIDGDEYYGYRENLYDIVKSNLQSFGISEKSDSISLIKGLLQETMIINQPVAFAHIDVDWYEPVLVTLERIYPHISVGGSIILDDYHDWGGCKKAVDECLAKWDQEFLIDNDAGSLKLTKL
jgi:asparagine synthase (glutamine-hydrolysing)